MMDGIGGAASRERDGDGSGAGAPLTKLTFKVLFVFSGVGGGALGFQRAQAEFRKLGVSAHFEIVGGIEWDPSTAKDFSRLTGAPCLCADVEHLTPKFLRDVFGDDPPDAVFFSPPCKSSSGLLSRKVAATPKYRAMSMLGSVWTELMFAAWPAGPKLLIMENVPRILTNAPQMMAAIRRTVRKQGYLLHEDAHDCGELGALAQHRDRLLFVARRKDLPALLYQPTKKRVRAIGEVLGKLPLPGDPRGGRLHRLAKIETITALRLALIPAGGDWSDLPSQVAVPPEMAAAMEKGRKRGPSNRTPFNDVYRVVHFNQPAPCVTTGATPSAGGISVADPRVGRAAPDDVRGDDHGVIGWDQPSGAITGRSVPSCGRFCVADPRMGRNHPDKARNDDHGVIGWDQPAGTVTGNPCPTNGRFSVADPRAGRTAPDGARDNDHGVVGWDQPSATITGHPAPACGRFSVADPRPGEGGAYARYGNNWRVERWNEAAHCVTGATDIQNGAPSVADPRPLKECHPHTYGVLGWEQPSHTITGNSGTPGGGPFSLADPRITCKTRENSGIYGVIPWQEPSGTIVAHACHDNGRFSVADPRWPESVPFPVIISLDGTWHRPLTALECAALQGFDAFDAEGKPLELDGSMDDVRVKIGDAVPVTTAEAIGRQMLFTLVDATYGTFSLSSGGDVWVRERQAAGYDVCPTVNDWGTA
jgi:site-specific DNA-cytosine methylase